jgi:hypothetical protein
MVALSDPWTKEPITEWLKANPPRTHPLERSLTKMVTAYVRQSFPLPTISDLVAAKFKLADWSSGRPRVPVTALVLMTV